MIRAMADPRTVLVTGASSGIGRATAELLAASGFRVFGASRRPPPAPLAGVHDAWLQVDVRDAASVDAAVRDLVSAAGALHAVVCCAGYSGFGSVEEATIEQARGQLETNVIGTLTVLRATLPRLRATRGRVVVVGSLAGRAPIPFQAHYSASKAALDALTLALRVEMAWSRATSGRHSTTTWTGVGAPTRGRRTPSGARAASAWFVRRSRRPPGPRSWPRRSTVRSRRAGLASATRSDPTLFSCRWAVVSCPTGSPWA
jgi:NAD(P)-dependent dehydrogenase (short-subunit alcohol dehydrogenase family)